MTQDERRLYLIEYLLKEQDSKKAPPLGEAEQKRLLRSLMNRRPPLSCTRDFLDIQDEYLRQENAAKGITDPCSLTPMAKDLYLWQGDITTLAAEAIVNAANPRLLGCFVPCHNCIDNIIHTCAGVQLRLECAGIIELQGHSEAIGGAKLTGGYNLPCRYILHTVGPDVSVSGVNDTARRQLASCYRACLELAYERSISSVAFCCISTGEFGFPNKEAAEIAVQTVKSWQAAHPKAVKVIFNVFKDIDLELYKNLLTH